MVSQMVPVGRLQVATPRSMALAIRNQTEAQLAVDERVEIPARDAATAAIADNPAVTAAAASAVADAAASGALMQTTDPRTLTQVDGVDGEATFGTFGARGEPTAATLRLSDGGWSEAAEQIVRDRLRMVPIDGGGVGFSGSSGEPTALTADPATGLLTTDGADLLRESIRSPRSRINTFARTSVRVPTPSGSRPLVSSRTRLLITGDSHAQAADVPATSRWHYLLSQARPDLTLTHASMGGSTAHMVALMAGGIEPSFTLDGDTFPASGSVSATLTDPLRYRPEVPLPATAGMAITSAGEIPATLSRAANSATFLLTRTTPGSAVTGPVRFRAATWDNNAADTMLVIMGQNDQITTPGNVGPVVEGYSALIESRLALNPHALFMGLVLGGNSVPYTQVWNYNVEIDRELSRLWPEHYWSLMRWLIEDALDVVTGITPTAGDETARRSYRTPPSLLLADQIHMNAATQAAFAPRVLAELVARNLIDA
ncbi:hypothetical protein MICRO8M_90036 [Microbacterium sp. 8M]|uniref:hypothetical protein n=1 Tax=Microbacterium sp. 8M TaxID=2653153 RepID=UPI0012EFCC14|nr:hypothetical protein [Microbacterium sp. 8M]VXC30366.1 hypothetical protein MICRO8M_90036 [Microbacterium sp. 8M]